MTSFVGPTCTPHWVSWVAAPVGGVDSGGRKKHHSRESSTACACEMRFVASGARVRSFDSCAPGNADGISTH